MLQDELKEPAFNLGVYISHKKVLPTPMTLGEYNTYQGWDLPSDQNGSDEGYLVEYLDGGKSNHPDHKGYISWTPKAQFDNGYTKLSCDASTFEGRLKIEASELSEKLGKLSSFIGSATFCGLSDESRDLLDTQGGLMLDYLTILEKRISLLVDI